MFPGATAHALIQAAARLGLDTAPLLAAIGEPAELLPDSAFDALWNAAATAWKRDDLELALAAQLPPGAFAPFDLSAITAPTVGQACIVLGRALARITGAGVSLAIEPAARGAMSVRLLNVTPASVEVSDALVVASFLTRLRQHATKPLTLERAWLTRAAPRVREPWTTFFGAPLRFGAKDSGLLFSAPAWRTTLISSNPATHRALAPLLPTVEGVFLDDVQAHVRNHLTEPDSLEQLAARLGLSSRTLQRRLSENHVTLRTLVTRTRVEEARRLIGQGRTGAEVARLVGFSSASALSRALAKAQPRATRRRAARST